MVKVSLNNASLEMEVDTGARYSIISKTTYNGLWPNDQAPKLTHTTEKLRTYTGELLDVTVYHIACIVMDHLEEVAPISSNQWGFMPGRSATSGLLSITNNCLQVLDLGYEVCMIFFYIRKAFDSVPHIALIETSWPAVQEIL